MKIPHPVLNVFGSLVIPLLGRQELPAIGQGGPDLFKLVEELLRFGIGECCKNKSAVINFVHLQFCKRTSPLLGCLCLLRLSYEVWLDVHEFELSFTCH